MGASIEDKGIDCIDFLGKTVICWRRRDDARRL